MAGMEGVEVDYVTGELEVVRREVDGVVEGDR